MRRFGSNEKICNSVVTLFKIFSLSSAIPNVQHHVIGSWIWGDQINIMENMVFNAMEYEHNYKVKRGFVCVCAWAHVSTPHAG